MFEAARENRPPDSSSVTVKENSFAAQGDKGIAAIMVEDIRKFLDDNYRAFFKDTVIFFIINLCGRTYIIQGASLGLHPTPYEQNRRNCSRDI